MRREAPPKNGYPMFCGAARPDFNNRMNAAGAMPGAAGETMLWQIDLNRFGIGIK